MKKLRKMGDITSDLEPLLLEMVDGHELQKGEIIAIISMYLDIHCPKCIEIYEDGSSPILSYGPKEE